MLTTYSTEEAAKILHVNERTVYRYLKSGKLHGRKPGKIWLFTDADLNNYLEQKTNQKAAKTK